MHRQLTFRQACERLRIPEQTLRDAVKYGEVPCRRQGDEVVFDADELAAWGSRRILALRGGRVLTEGGPKEVLTPELMRELYGVEVEVSSLFDDKVRVCTPASVARGG